MAETQRKALLSYQVQGLPLHHFPKVTVLPHSELCLPRMGSASSLPHEMPILAAQARCRVHQEFMDKFWLCVGNLASLGDQRCVAGSPDTGLRLVPPGLGSPR